MAGSGSAEGCWRLEPTDDAFANCCCWDEVLLLLGDPGRNSIQNKRRQFLLSFAVFNLLYTYWLNRVEGAESPFGWI